MGSGKEINLENTSLLQEKIDASVEQIKDVSNSVVLLYLGEPNCRIKLSNHWTPHWDELHKGVKINSEPDVAYLRKCIRDYQKLDMKNIDYILTPTCAYDPVIPSLVEFNRDLKEAFGSKVIDIFKHTIDEKSRVFEKFKAKDWKKDPIHLNSRICRFLLEEIVEKNIIFDKSDYSATIDGYFGTHLLRCADVSKFGSFMIKDEQTEEEKE